MYLIIGDERDPCVLAVRFALERRGEVALTSPNPFGSAGRLRWIFDTENSSLEYAFAGGAADLEGVFVRNFAALSDIQGWSPEDAAYMNSEGTAALLACLHAVQCPVVGRPSDDAWYRPQRPLPEWVGLLGACGLPTPTLVVTNAPQAEAFAAAWSGRATYQPLTSPRSYAIQGAAWAELDKVMAHVPVCLCEPMDGPVGAVTLVGERLFWTNPPDDRDQLEGGVRRVAARLESDFVQLSYQIETEGPKFTAIHLQPMLELHEASDQERIADEIAGRMIGSDAPRAVRRARQNAEVRS